MKSLHLKQGGNILTPFSLPHPSLCFSPPLSFLGSSFRCSELSFYCFEHLCGLCRCVMMWACKDLVCSSSIHWVSATQSMPDVWATRQAQVGQSLLCSISWQRLPVKWHGIKWLVWGPDECWDCPSAHTVGHCWEVGERVEGGTVCWICLQLIYPWVAPSGAVWSGSLRPLCSGLDGASQMLTFIYITRMCSNVDSDSVGLWWGWWFCISIK